MSDPKAFDKILTEIIRQDKGIKKVILVDNGFIDFRETVFNGTNHRECLQTLILSSRL